MNDTIQTLRERTQRLHRSLGRLESLWEKVASREPGPLREGLTVLLAQALDRNDGTAHRASSPMARPLDSRGELLPGDSSGCAALLGTLGSVDSGFALDSFEILIVLAEGLLESERDPYVGTPDRAWISDFQQLVRGDVDQPLAAFPQSFARRWSGLKEFAERRNGSSRFSFEMAMARTLRGLVSWGLGQSRLETGSAKGPLALRLGEAVLGEFALR